MQRKHICNDVSKEHTRALKKKHSSNAFYSTDLFCDQLVDDLQAYKQNSPENPDEVTAEDMILLMRRYT